MECFKIKLRLFCIIICLCIVSNLLEQIMILLRIEKI